MRETDNDKQELQTLIDYSITQAGAFLKKSFQMPDCSLSAEELVERLAGSFTVSLATVTQRGEPRVAPINAMFYRGRYYVPTVQSAARTRMIQNNSAISLTHYDGDDFAILIHGQATLVFPNHIYYADLDELRQSYGMSDINQWGKGNEGVYIRIEPRVLYTYTRRS